MTHIHNRFLPPTFIVPNVSLLSEWEKHHCYSVISCCFNMLSFMYMQLLLAFWHLLPLNDVWRMTYVNVDLAFNKPLFVYLNLMIALFYIKQRVTCSFESWILITRLLWFMKWRLSALDIVRLIQLLYSSVGLRLTNDLIYAKTQFRLICDIKIKI